MHHAEWPCWFSLLQTLGFQLPRLAQEQGAGGTTGNPILCKDSDEQLGQEFDLGQAPAPSGSGRAEGSVQESRAGCCP